MYSIKNTILRNNIKTTNSFFKSLMLCWVRRSKQEKKENLLIFKGLRWITVSMSQSYLESSTLSWLLVGVSSKLTKLRSFPVLPYSPPIVRLDLAANFCATLLIYNSNITATCSFAQINTNFVRISPP